MKPYAVFLFNVTQSQALPWARAGVRCYLVDIQHPPGERADPSEPNIIYVGADARHWFPRESHKPVYVACNPPCTDIAVSGARWFAAKGLRRLAQAIELFAVAQEFTDWAGCPFLIENPVSVISTHWRKPDHTFHPWQFAGYLDDIQAENTTKLTCLWTGGGFVMPAERPAPSPHRNDVWKMPPSEERANMRSASPRGFSLAVFLSNQPAAAVAA